MMWLMASVMVVLGAAGSPKPADTTAVPFPRCSHQLTSGGGIWVRNPKRAYGQPKTVRLLREAIAEVRRRYPGTPDVMVGDLSTKGGGRLRPHLSHRDGRDADVGYYFKDRRARRWFQKATAKTLDVERQWALFESLIATGEVQFIFVAYPLQRALYKHARKKGVPKRTLSRLFQWPRPWRRRAGLIRLEFGHQNHFHVRFQADGKPGKKEGP